MLGLALVSDENDMFVLLSVLQVSADENSETGFDDRHSIWRAKIPAGESGR